jgi:LPXTG-site transpeptidase (sortase) family protein
MKKELYKKIKAQIKGPVKNFLFIFVLTFVFIYFAFNFEVIYKNIKYEIEKRLPGKVNIIGEAAIIEVLKGGKEAKLTQDIIFIPKINVEAPIIIPKSNSKSDLLEALKNGVILRPDFSLPGENGITVIEGHSSPNLAGFGKYNSVFSLLGKLEYGDKIIVYYNKKEYKYKVIKKIIFKPEDDIQNIANKADLFLVTCWPIGTNFKRIGIQARY